MSFVEEMCGWLSSLPENATVTWGQPHLSVAPDVHTSWVDVYIPAADEHVSFNWTWTVIDPETAADEGVSDSTLVVAHDVDIWSVWSRDALWHLDEGPVFVTRRGANPHPSQAGALERAADADPEDRSVRVTPAWSSVALCDAMVGWAAARAGRSDLSFVYDETITSPMIESLSNIDFESMETYDLGPGVKVTSQAMDQLLGMEPDVAAGITAGLRKAFGGDDPVVA